MSMCRINHDDISTGGGQRLDSFARNLIDADSGAELAFEDALRQALPLLAFARLDRATDCACAQAPCERPCTIKTAA